MDFQNYDDYMRSSFGFSGMNSQMGMPMGMQNTCCSNMNCPNMGMTPFSNMASNPMWQDSSDLERMYPDSYRVIYPMVVSACASVTMPVTEDMISRMTDDIYDRAVADGRISIDINVEVETRDDRDDKDDRQMMNRPPRRPRPRRNRFLNDFIRVLLLRELLERRRRPGFPRF